jgi:hypothetical protein
VYNKDPKGITISNMAVWAYGTALLKILTKNIPDISLKNRRLILLNLVYISVWKFHIEYKGW